MVTLFHPLADIDIFNHKVTTFPSGLTLQHLQSPCRHRKMLPSGVSRARFDNEGDGNLLTLFYLPADIADKFKFES